MSQLLTWLSALAWQCPSLPSPGFLTPSPVPLITSVLVSQYCVQDISYSATKGFGNTIIFLYTFLFFIVSLYVSTVYKSLCALKVTGWCWMSSSLSIHPGVFRDSICPWTWNSPFQLKLPSQQTPRICLSLHPGTRLLLKPREHTASPDLLHVAGILTEDLALSQLYQLLFIIYLLVYFIVTFT